MIEDKKNKEISIFILRSCGNLTGTERVLLNWCRFIDYEKNEVMICAHKGSFWEIFKKETPRVRMLDFVFDNNLKGITRFVNSLKFFKKLKVNRVIWLLNGMGGFVPSEIFASWIASKGNLYFSHHIFPEKIEHAKPRKWLGLLPGIGFWRIKKFLKIYFEHLLARKVLAVSNDVKDSLVNYWKISPLKINVVRGGIDINYFYFDFKAKKRLKEKLKLSERTKIFIAINRFSKEKRIDRLLGAFLLLLRDYPDIFLLIAGEGNLKIFYEQRVNRNSFLKERTKFLGFREDINRFIQGSDFLLLASDNEGQSSVIKEAMACGIIPIATDSPGTEEINNNIFVSKKNVFDLYHKIKFVLALSEDKISKIREQIIKEAKEKYELKENCSKELRDIGIRYKN